MRQQSWSGIGPGPSRSVAGTVRQVNDRQGTVDVEAVGVSRREQRRVERPEADRRVPEPGRPAGDDRQDTGAGCGRYRGAG
ncbi:hypothetical protein ACFWMT_16905 [Streptomyces sp. NPDC058368]|uniref:hypothetical protein n=1 Tax=Streptomyces sp. NPDC058368 TaxID=3346461 RepID=UPI0036513A1B